MLLFINALKGLKKKKIQMLGIILMVMLSTAIYTSMNVALDRLENRYYNYLDEQKVEDISFDVKIDYNKDVTLEDIDYLKKERFTNITDDESKLLEAYIGAITNNNFTVELTNNIEMLFKKYDANEYIEIKKLDILAKKYDFVYEKQSSKTYKQDKTFIKIIPYSVDKKINVTYLIEGNLPVNENEITMLPRYAKIHNLKIGDYYEIGDTSYKIVGFTYAPDYIYPLISYSMPIFDEKNNNVIFMNEESYKLAKGITEETYSIKYNYPVEVNISALFDREPNDDPIANMFREQANTISLNEGTITRTMRINALQMEFASNRLFAEYFLYVLLGVAVFIILIITKKRIDDERLQIGVLKSLGYQKWSVAISYLVYPVIGSLIGGVLGYLIGISLNGSLASMYVNYYTVPLSGFSINIKYLIIAIFIPMVVLSLLSYLIAIFMLRKKPLDLLKEGSNLRVNFFSKIVNKITSIFPFKYRFKYALASRSLGKLIVVTLTSFATGMLIVLTLIGSNLFNSMIEKTFESMDYKYIVLMNQNMTGTSDEDDLVLMTEFTIMEIKDSEGKNKKIDKDQTISLIGLDKKMNYLNPLDEKGNNIIDPLKEDEIIINTNMAEVMNISIGDTLVFNYPNNVISYKVSNVFESYMDMQAYVLRSDLSSKLGFPNSMYNGKYSIDDRYNNLTDDDIDSKYISYVLNISDLRENIESQMSKFNSSVYFVIAFASTMACIIIGVIANIVVEENKKTISLMKVIGYENKEITSIVLNIYTPFVIIAYLLSIPAMTKLLKYIINQIVGDMNMAIPVQLDPIMAIIGLIGLLTAYFIAINLSRRVLNKVPLATALKRE
ncbi:MAG TPA: FtsX-like permease family protein [Tenericutes bacterium]|nr:FtsX-like permease family protein [Mycoplasmatota bacterium]